MRRSPTYVGDPPEARADIAVAYFAPTREGWQGGDREVTCYLTPADGNPITVPYKAGGRARGELSGMLRVGSIVIRVDDLEREAAFWEAALGYQRRDTGADDFLLLKPRDGNGPNVSLDRVRAPSRCRRRSTSTCTPRTRRARSNASRASGRPRSTGTSGPPTPTT